MFKIYKVTDHGIDGKCTSTVGYFATPELADEVKKGHGAMGFGDGSVDILTVFEESDLEALRFTKAGRATEQAEKARVLAKLTDRERRLLNLEDGFWTYEGYWYIVLGLGKAEQVVAGFKLVVDGLSEWLSKAEEAAISVYNLDRGETLEDWAPFHVKAIDELKAAIDNMEKPISTLAVFSRQAEASSSKS